MSHHRCVPFVAALLLAGCAASNPPTADTTGGTVATSGGLGAIPDGAELVDLPSGQALRFYVTHLHGGGLTGRCYGQLDIGPDMLSYLPSDNSPHAMSAPRNSVTARAPGLGPEVHLTIGGQTQRFIVVDRDMVERVRSVLATRAHTKNPKSLVAALVSFRGEQMGFPPARSDLAASRGADTPRRPATRAAAAPARHFYRLEQKLDFNVLDGAWFDPASGQVTLFGHHDPRYVGEQIPYLQHLAALLENPRPEMTLEWTPDSERRVNAFLERRESRSDAQRAAREMAQFLDSSGRVTQTGRLLLAGWGIKPTRNGAAQRGYIGVDVVQHGDWQVRITRVAAGSPAAQAGLKPGDIIEEVNGYFPVSPAEFHRWIGFTGAAFPIGLRLSGGVYKTVRLGAASGDPWSAMDRLEVIYKVLFLGANMKAAETMDYMGALERHPAGSPTWSGAYSNFLAALGLSQEMLRLRAQHGATDYMASLLQPQVATRLEQIFGIPAGTIRSRYDDTYRRTGDHRQAGRQMDLAIKEMEYTVIDRALSRLRSRAQGVLIAPELVDRTWGVKPQVQPRYMGVRGETQLARVMLEADYLGKQLVNSPELKGRIPAYQTQYEFLQRNPAFDRDRAAYRMWISVGRFRAVQSPDHSTLEIRDIAMRFNIREIRGGRNVPPQPGDYQELLTSLYEPLAREFFVLHETREAAKLAGVAEWIRARDPSFRLPAPDAPTWRSPATLPGMVFVYLGGGDAGGTAMMTTFATGGVALTPYEHSGRVPLEVLAAVDSSVVDLRDVRSGTGRPVIAPRQFTNTALSRVLKKENVVPPPRPEAWVAMATLGKRTMRTVSVMRERAAGVDSVELNKKLTRLVSLAEQLEKVDALINAENVDAPELQRRFSAMIAQLEKDRAAYCEDSLAVVSQLVSAGAVKLKPGTAKYSVDGALAAIDGAEDMRGKFETWHSRLQALRSSDLELQTRELVGIAGELGELVANPRAIPGLGRVLEAADQLKSIVNVGTGFFLLQMKSDYEVGQLADVASTRLRLLNSVLPYRDRLQREIIALQRDPALRSLQLDGG